MNPTPRQLEVIAAIVRTGSTGAAARELGMSYNTADNHLRDLKERVNAQTTTHAVALLLPIIDPLIGPLGKAA
jgi:molybdate transport repressor ModE-like protein